MISLPSVGVLGFFFCCRVRAFVLLSVRALGIVLLSLRSLGFPVGLAKLAVRVPLKGAVRGWLGFNLLGNRAPSYNLGDGGGFSRAVGWSAGCWGLAGVCGFVSL